MAGYRGLAVEHAVAQQLLDLRRDAVPLRAGELQRHPLHRLGRRFGVGAAEGQPAAEQHVRHDSDAPDVGGVGVAHAVGEDLRRGVLDGARLLEDQLLRVVLACQAKVAELELFFILREAQDILGLDVAVHHAEFVAVRHRRHQLHDDLTRRRLGERRLEARGVGRRLPSDHEAEEVAPADHLLHEVQRLLLLEQVEDLDDVRVAAALVLQPRLLEQVRLLEALLVRRHDLHRPHQPGLAVSALEDPPKLALAQQPAERVRLAEGAGVVERVRRLDRGRRRRDGLPLLQLQLLLKLQAAVVRHRTFA